jgi:hypothetical protein
VLDGEILVSAQIIRCPICLLSQPVRNGVSPDKILHCGNCQRDFAVKDGLPLKDDIIPGQINAPVSTATTTTAGIAGMEPATTRNTVITWILGAIIALVVIKTSRSYVAPLDGPAFLVFYLLLFVGIWVALTIMRKLWEDSVHVTMVALLAFEAVGLNRYLDASAAGMHKFGFMFIMMTIGAVLLFARYDHPGGNNGYGSSCSSCSSCSGCGGGGGCGGCGD